MNNNNVNGDNTSNNHNLNSGFPNWMPAGMFTTPVAFGVPQGGGASMNMNMNVPNVNVSATGGFDMSDGSASAGFATNSHNNASTGFGAVPMRMGGTLGAKKRGQPRKNPL